MRLAFILLSFAILASVLSASQLGVLVSGSQGTLEVGMNVSLMTGGVEFAMHKTGNDGYALFNVTDGSYFVLIHSSIYPLFVSLVGVHGDTNVSLSIRQEISYASVYGQISGPKDFSQVSVSVSQGGMLVKKAVPDANGFFLMSFLPEGPYELDFSAPGFVGVQQNVTLYAADFFAANPRLSAQVQPPPPQLALAAPVRIEQKSIIEVSLLNGSAPVSGASISAQTPSGNVSLATGSDGKAHLNAAEPGVYNFTYGNLTAATYVPESAQQTQENQTQQQQQPSQQQETGTQAGEPSAQQGGLLFAAGTAMFAFLVVIGLAALVFIAIRMMRKKKPGYHRKR